MAEKTATYHPEAAQRHLVSAARHDDTARRWVKRDDVARADFHKRVAAVERELARLHAGMAEVEQQRSD